MLLLRLISAFIQVERSGRPTIPIRLFIRDNCAWRLVYDRRVNSCCLKCLQGRLILCLTTLNKLSVIWIFIVLSGRFLFFYVTWWNERLKAVRVILAFATLAARSLPLLIKLKQLLELLVLCFKSCDLCLKLLKAATLLFSIWSCSYSVLYLFVFLAWKDLAHLL